MHTFDLGRMHPMVHRYYSAETRERAVRLVREKVPGDARSEWRRICDVCEQLGMSPETLRLWVRQAEVNDGEREGVPSAAAAEIAELRRRNAELEATVEILRAASAFFAREYDPRPSRSAGSSRSTETGSESYRSAER
jgi:transposase-like protein